MRNSNRVTRGINTVSDKMEQLDFRTRIEVECDKKGISRAALARKIGKTPQTLNDMLARGNMKATVLKEVAVALGVSMEHLMEPVTDEEYAEVKIIKRKRRKANRKK